MEINIADGRVLEMVLKRKRWGNVEHDESYLGEMFSSLLGWANDFVPSESGSIFLDNPITKHDPEKQNRLYFIACFGKNSKPLAGTHMPDDVGVVGKVYTTGEPYLSEKVEDDEVFHSEIDDQTNFQTRSLVGAPIKIKGSIIGVIELINKIDGVNYTEKDLTLLKVFAGYASTLVQNFLDAKVFRDLSIIDNLTGLFNDRHFFTKLHEETERALNEGSDVSLIFLDLDHFKEVNDTYGHLAGSHLLHEIGTILADLTDDTEIIPVRYGGDEFSLILPSMGIDEGAELAERIRSAIAKYVFLARPAPGVAEPLNIKDAITCSVGVSSIGTEPGVERKAHPMSEALIKKADKAMYAAQEAGKNKVVLSTELEEE